MTITESNLENAVKQLTENFINIQDVDVQENHLIVTYIDRLSFETVSYTHL